MKTIIHPDYWVEIPAGEFLLGLSEAQRDAIRRRIWIQIDGEQLPEKERQLAVGLMEKHRAWSQAGQPLELNQQELEVRRYEPFKTIFEVEHLLSRTPSQTSVWLDRFYIARFPITERQCEAFEKGAAVESLPGVLEEPVRYVQNDERLKRQFEIVGRKAADVGYKMALSLCQNLGGRLPTVWEWEKAGRGTDGWLYPWGNKWNFKAGFFFEGQDVTDGERVDAFPEGVSPCGVWAMLGYLPELVVGFKLRPFVARKGFGYKESSAKMAWLDYIIAGKGTGRRASLRPVLAEWPGRQWPGFQSGVETTQRSRPVSLGGLPEVIIQGNNPPIHPDNIHKIIPLAERRLWDTRVEAGETIEDLAWSANGKWLAVAQFRGVNLYQVDELKPIVLDSCKSVVAFSWQGNILATAGQDYKSLYLLDVEEIADKVMLTTPEQFLTCLCFNPDKTMLASGDQNGEINLWDITSHNLVFTLSGHQECISYLMFNPSGNLLASGSVDQTVRLWDIKSGSEVSVLVHHTRPVYDVAFSSDGSILASAGADSTVRLWNMEHKTEQQVLRDPDGNLAVSVSFNPDGSLLAVGYSNGMFKVWSVATGETLTTIQCDMGWNIKVAFSPDGKWLATYSQNVVLWGLPAER